jgi:hypothetical protein
MRLTAAPFLSGQLADAFAPLDRDSGGIGMARTHAIARRSAAPRMLSNGRRCDLFVHRSRREKGDRSAFLASVAELCPLS